VTPIWPFSVLQRRKYDREFNAALIVLLGTYRFARLSAEEKARVDREVNDILKVDPDYVSDIRQWRALDSIGAFRGIAMARLGIATGISGPAWQEMLRFWEETFLDLAIWERDMRTGFVLWDYRAGSTATADAKRYLRQHGLDIPDVEAANPWEMESLLGTASYPDAEARRAEWLEKWTLDPHPNDGPPAHPR